jgi:hypothetical protein
MFLRLAVLGLLWAVFASSSASGQSLSEVDSIAARFDYRRWHCEVKGDKYELTHTTRVTVSNRRGDKYGRISLWTSSFVDLKYFKARVLDSRGKVIYTRDKGDLEETCGGGRRNYYSDICQYTATLGANTYPYVLEYEYRKESESLFFLRGAVFQRDVPVTEATYILEIPAGLDFRYKGYGADFEPTMTDNGKRHTYTWSVGPLQALKSEDHVPPGANAPIRLGMAMGKFSLGSYEFDRLDWSHVGQWYDRLACDHYDTEIIQQEAPVELTDSITRAAYYEVTGNIRYVALEIGIGGWQPYRATTTAGRGWGDCKDMSTLLISRLRGLGVRAYPALVLVRSMGPLDSSSASFDFNHVITAALVGNDTVWMDPTCRLCPYGDLPDMDEGINVLFVSDFGGAVVRTPYSSPQENFKVRKTRWVLESDDHATFTCTLVVGGNFATDFRYRLIGLDADARRQLVESQFHGLGTRLIVTDWSIKAPDSLELPVTMTVSGHTRRQLDRTPAALYLDAFQLIEPREYETLRVDERTLPIDVGYPWKAVDTIEIVAGPAVSISEIVLPEPDTLLTTFSHIILAADPLVSPNRIVLEKEYFADRIDSNELEAFDAFQDHFKDIATTLVPIVVFE